jgi:fermentation-respiration switch protein FrsA (DUF1100 family)
MEFERTLRQVRCPVLLIHGEKDEIIRASNAYDNARLIGSLCEVNVIPQGDHMCTHALEHTVGPMVFRWLSETLRKREAQNEA